MDLFKPTFIIRDAGLFLWIASLPYRAWHGLEEGSAKQKGGDPPANRCRL